MVNLQFRSGTRKNERHQRTRNDGDTPNDSVGSEVLSSMMYDRPPNSFLEWVARQLAERTKKRTKDRTNHTFSLAAAQTSMVADALTYGGVWMNSIHKPFPHWIAELLRYKLVVACRIFS